MGSRGGNSTRGRSRAISLCLAAASALVLVSAAPASAGTLDQQQTSANSNSALFANQIVAQTFRAGLSGGLDQVDLSLLKVGNPPATITVEIRDVSGGKPGTVVLATATIPTSAVGAALTFLPATFTAPARVTAGEQYTIVVYSQGTGGNTAAVGIQLVGNPYPNGSSFFTNEVNPPWTEQANADYAFKTYVRTSTCKGQTANRVGTEGNDVITGTAGIDVVAGLGGNDTLSGLAGNDLLCGGAGKDKLKGGPGKDKLFGEAGKDKLIGGGAKDVCKGGGGKDSAKCEVAKSL